MEQTKQQAEHTKKEIQQTYVVTSGGGIYQIVISAKNPKYCVLRSRTSYIKKKVNEVRQQIVDGKWRHPNEGELKAHLKAEGEHIQESYNHSIRIFIVSSLLIELYDQADILLLTDKYLRNKVISAANQLEKYSGKLWDKIIPEHRDDLIKISEDTQKFCNLFMELSPEDISEVFDYAAKIKMFKKNVQNADISP